MDELLAGKGSLLSKTAQAENLLRELLEDESVATEMILQKAQELGISEWTANIAKKNLNIRAEKIGDRWFWKLPESRV